jgi:hypothetical protein
VVRGGPKGGIIKGAAQRVGFDRGLWDKDDKVEMDDGGSSKRKKIEDAHHSQILTWSHRSRRYSTTS